MNQRDHLEQLQELADKHSKYLKLGFLSAIKQLRDSIDEEELANGFLLNSTDSILRTVDPDQFDNLLHGIGLEKPNMIFTDESMSVFHLAAIAAFLQLAPEIRQKWAYNKIADNVVARLLADSSRIAQELTFSMRSSLTTALQSIIVSNKSIVAKIKELKQTIGLTEPQIQAVLNFRSQLETRRLLGFTAPYDRAMSEADKLLLYRHMKQATMSQATIDKMVNRYYENFLNQRSTEIATATTMNAINAGMQSMWDQGFNQGILDVRDRKFWVTAGDHKVRTTHRAIPGMNPNGVAINSMFITPTGPVPFPMWGMGDYHNCRCIVVLKRI